MVNRPKPRDIVTKRPLNATPRAPAWLSKDARREWQRVAPILVDRRVLTEADLGSLEAYCTAVGRIAECERILKRDGLITTGPNGGATRHPAVPIQDAATKTARQLAVEFGLSPASRSRPAIRDDSDDDGKLDDLGL